MVYAEFLRAIKLRFKLRSQIGLTYRISRIVGFESAIPLTCSGDWDLAMKDLKLAAEEKNLIGLEIFTSNGVSAF